MLLFPNGHDHFVLCVPKCEFMSTSILEDKEDVAAIFLDLECGAGFSPREIHVSEISGSPKCQNQTALLGIQISRPTPDPQIRVPGNGAWDWECEQFPAKASQRLAWCSPSTLIHLNLL